MGLDPLAKKSDEEKKDDAAMDITEDLDDCVETDTSGMYELVACVTHKGRSADSGHYVGWTKKLNGSEEKVNEPEPESAGPTKKPKKGKVNMLGCAFCQSSLTTFNLWVPLLWFFL